MLLIVYGGERYLATAKHNSSTSHIDVNIGNVVVTSTEDAKVLNTVQVVDMVNAKNVISCSAEMSVNLVCLMVKEKFY